MSFFIRSAVLTNYAELARSVGLDPQAMLASVGLNVASLASPDLRIPAEAVLQLLEQSALASGEEAFGLRLAETRRLSTFGLLGVLARDEPTLRHVLGTFIRYGRLHNQALSAELEECGDVAVLRQDLLPASEAGRQSMELAVGAMCRVLRIFVGSDWQPRWVSFMHPPPRSMAVHHAILGDRVRFTQDFNGMVLTRADLETPIAFADPVMANFARGLLDRQRAFERHPTRYEVQQLILTLLPTGRCKIEQIAIHMGVDRKTIHRRLVREGCTFSDLLQATRRGLLERYLQYGDRTLSEVALLLGFGSLSAFSRWRRPHR